MTVNTTSNKVTFAGNGSTVSFNFPFRIFAASDLRVIVRSAAGVESVKTLTTDYTVGAGPWPTGGLLTMTVAPAVSETLLIKRQVAATQLVDYITADSFPAETHEAALDKLTMICQQIEENIGRTLTLQETTALAAFVMPDPTPGQVLYSPDGLTLAWAALSSLAGATLLTPVSIAQGGTGAATAAAARTALAVLALAGGTLTGPLVLAADPTVPLGAATKQYIDALLTNMGYLNVPQVNQSGNYQTIASDAAKHIRLTGGSAATFTIAANATVAYPIGTTITFVNSTSPAQVLSIAIGGTDTMTLAGTTTPGTRSLAQNGIATAIKITATAWLISGTGLT